MYNLILIGIGGFIGAILRYLISGFIQGNNINFPYGTLGVNTIGSFVLSFIMYSTEYKGIFSEESRLLLSVGMLGAFTTMSTFSYESFRLFERENYLLFLLNIGLTIIFTLSAIYLGRISAKVI